MTEEGPNGPTAESAPPARSSEDERAPNTLLNALIGGVLGIVVSFVPFSTVLGGGVAGYLEGGDSRSGARVGALAGLVAFVPLVLVIGVLFVFIPVTGGPNAEIPAGFWLVVVLVLLLTAVYSVGLSAFGGVLGVYVKNEF